MKIDGAKPYSKMTKREKFELKRTIRTQNKKLARLEKKGLASSSAAYRYLEGQLAAGANWLYRDKSGNIRFRENISKMSAQTLSKVKHETKAFRQTQTSTIKGTRAYKKNLVTSYNNMLSKMGITQKVTAEDVKDIHESALYKKLSEMYGSGDAVKIIMRVDATGSTAMLDELINSGRLSPTNIIDPDALFKLIDTHDDYEQAVQGVPGISSEEIRDILVDYAAFDLYTPAQFKELLDQATRHKEDDESLADAVRGVLDYQYR